MNSYMVAIIWAVVWFLVGYIFRKKSSQNLFGSIVIEQSDDPSKNDQIRFMFEKNLDDLYSAKRISLNVIKIAHNNNNSDNDNN